MTFKLRSHVMGGHVHATLFVGADDEHLQSTGNVVMGLDQWAAFVLLLVWGAPARRFDADPADLILDHDDERLARAIFDRGFAPYPNQPKDE